MDEFSKSGMGTLVNHIAEGDHANHSHVMPIYQTSAFSFPNVEAGAKVFRGESDDFCYSRIGNPNSRQLAKKYAYLEGLDLIRQSPEKSPDEIVTGFVYASGMGAITTALLSYVKAGDTIIAQRALYGGTHAFFSGLAPKFGVKIVWMDNLGVDDWQRAFEENPTAVMAYIETPANPTMDIVDLKAVAEIAHHYGAVAMVDNTFATPFNQRPLTLGFDIIAHSTTKYLTGHGLVIGGAIVTTDMDFGDPNYGALYSGTKVLGSTPSPFDNWLAAVGLKTFEVRMQRHNENAQIVAEWLQDHKKIETVYYPGLSSHAGHEIAKKQMFNGFGGMISFEVKGGFDAGVTLMNSLNMITLAVSLGNVDSLIQHPASMTHAVIPAAERLSMGLTDGMVRFSVGIENVEDIMADLDQALARI